MVAGWHVPPLRHGRSWHDGQLATPTSCTASAANSSSLPLISILLIQPTTAAQCKWYFTLPPLWWEYQWVCPRAYLRNHVSKLHTKFLVHVACGHGSVLHRRCSNSAICHEFPVLKTTSYFCIVSLKEACQYHCRLTPLLLCVGCVLSETTAGANSRHVYHARGLHAMHNWPVLSLTLMVENGKNGKSTFPLSTVTVPLIHETWQVLGLLYVQLIAYME